jgi:cell division protein FtsI (penicillin-binding protein 3)
MKKKSAATPQAVRRTRQQARRYGVILALFALSALILGWRAIDQQLLQKDFLQKKGNQRHLAEHRLPAYRGVISDRRGTVLALSTPLVSIAVDPRKLPTDIQQLAILAKALRIPLKTLQKKLQKHAKKHHLYLKKQVPPDYAAHVIKIIKAAKITGVYLEKQQHRRFYPAGEAFSQILGFTDYQDQGQEGLERLYNNTLQGKPGYKRVLRNGHRTAVQDLANSRLPEDGQPLTLSLDHRLQYIAYRELKTAVQQHQAIGGSAVLLDTRTGEVLAMVNQPGFNPNDGSARTGSKVRNRAITDVFEPGSTMKPLIVATALETGKLESDSLVDTSGQVQIGELIIQDTRELGQIDLATLLGLSSNEGAARITLSLDKADLWQQLQQFGFGESLQTGFPAEARGHLPDYAKWSKTDQASLGFGYGISGSTLHLAQAYAILANDGIRLPISLLKQERPPVGTRVLHSETARATRELLQSVVSPTGTAPQASIPGYRVAGKTGTARKIHNGTYSTDQYHAIFVGITPLEQPRLALAIVLDEPRNGEYYGGRVAGPVFAKVMGEALRLLNIPPEKTTPLAANAHE